MFSGKRLQVRGSVMTPLRFLITACVRWTRRLWQPSASSSRLETTSPMRWGFTAVMINYSSILRAEDAAVMFIINLIQRYCNIVLQALHEQMAASVHEISNLIEPVAIAAHSDASQLGHKVWMLSKRVHAGLSVYWKLNVCRHLTGVSDGQLLWAAHHGCHRYSV